MSDTFHIEPRRYTLKQSLGRIEIDAEDFMTPGKVIVDCVSESGELVASYTNQTAWIPNMTQFATLTHRGTTDLHLGFPAYLRVQVDVADE